MNVEMIFANEYDSSFDDYEEYYKDVAYKLFSHLSENGNFIFEIDLVGEEQIHQINRDYRNVDRPTDVISFAFEDNNDFENLKFKDTKVRDLGEILICVDVARKQALEYCHSFKREMTFLFVHGLLHLLGYDHMTIEEEKVMFGIQDEIMDKLGL